MRRPHYMSAQYSRACNRLDDEAQMTIWRLTNSSQIPTKTWRLSNNPHLHANRIEELDAPVLKYVIEILGVLDLRHLSQSLLLHNNANSHSIQTAVTDSCGNKQQTSMVWWLRETNAEAMNWKMGLRCSKISIFIVVAFFLFGSAWVRFVSLNTIVRFELWVTWTMSKENV